jgi:hypothetical protein
MESELDLSIHLICLLRILAQEMRVLKQAGRTTA